MQYNLHLGGSKFLSMKERSFSKGESAQKNLKKAYEDAIEELNAVKKEKTLWELEREELKEKARKDVLEFYNKTSHSIRMPLAIITGYADILLGDMVVEDDVSMEYLKKICTQAYYLNDAFTQLLLEAKVNSQLPVLEVKSINLYSMFLQTIQDISVITLQKGILIQIVAENKELAIEADEIQLTKVFYNLFENSIKYMNQRGKIVITLSDLGHEVLIIVKDDGQGLAAHEVEQIFDLHFQGSNKKYGGGLGLFMAKGIVTAHGGTIYAKSQRGRGMGIYITLPKKTPVLLDSSVS